MQSKRVQGSGSYISLLFALGIVFLAPLYHSHSHTNHHHAEYGDDHIPFQNGADLELLATQAHCSAPHLHIVKAIGRIDTRLSFTGRSLKQAFCAIPGLSVLIEALSGRRLHYSQTAYSRSTACVHHSGLSPPSS